MLKWTVPICATECFKKYYKSRKFCLSYRFKECKHSYAAYILLVASIGPVGNAVKHIYNINLKIVKTTSLILNKTIE